MARLWYSSKGLRHAAAGAVVAATCLAVLAFPTPDRAWGTGAERLVTGNAIETLPPDIRGFFESNREFLARHVTEPLDLLAKNSFAERRNHYLYLDRYGKFPFDGLPRDYKAALNKYSKSKLESSGVLPWQIGVYSQKLTAAMRDHDWDQTRLAAAYLAAYVAQAHDPFHTTEDFDGHLSGQPGVDLRFGSNLVDRFSLFFPMRVDDASFLQDPTGHAFDAALSAHASLENILLADRRAREGQSDYTDEYFDRFYNLAGPILIRQLSDAATDIGSYWLSAWINAGRPQLPSQ
jgi:hypothetical protein